VGSWGGRGGGGSGRARYCLQWQVTIQGPEKNKITITDCICFEHDVLLRVQWAGYVG